jgi:hypothetical protein
MRLDRSPAPYLAQGPCARIQFPPSTIISHTFSDWRKVVCFDRSGEPGICQGRFKSISPYRSQNQNRFRYVSSFSLDPGRCPNVIYDRSTKRLFSEKGAYLVRARACHGQRRP